MEDKILEILEDIRPEFDFNDSDDFIEDGYLDSFDIVNIISELEQSFNVIIDGLEVIPENFVSVSAIAELVEKSKNN